MENRTRILVTHSVQLCVPLADYLILMDQSRIDFEGHPSEAGGIYQELTQLEGIYEKSKVTRRKTIQRTPIHSEEHLSSASLDHSAPHKTTVRVTEDEQKAKGSVSFDVYKLFLKAAGGWLFVLILISSYVISILLGMGHDYW